jgi:predicted peptidase
MQSTRVKIESAEELVAVSSRKIYTLLTLWLAITIPAHARNHDTGFLDRSIVLQGTTYKYQVFVPETWTPHQKWPIILFLHGAGERGNDGMQQTDIGIGTEIRSDRGRIPAIVVMPQCPKNLWWSQPPMDDLAMATLDAASKEFHGDPDRTYVTGLSMGGYGTWHLAEKYPHKFAALVVICGGIRPPPAILKAHPELAKWFPADEAKSYSDAAAKVGRIPVWIFHGADDDTVPVSESRRMYAAMKEIGAEVHYTEYPGIKHVSWDKAYDDEKLFPWLFSKTLASKTPVSKTFASK